jgi:hypothetical protein
MSEPSPGEPPAAEQESEFERHAEQSQPGLLREFLDFLIHNKKWWLVPIVLVLLLIGILVILGASPAAPFIYTLF